MKPIEVAKRAIFRDLSEGRTMEDIIRGALDELYQTLDEAMEDVLLDKIAILQEMEA